jgi:hypothetical protein
VDLTRFVTKIVGPRMAKVVQLLLVLGFAWNLVERRKRSAEQV